MKKIVILLLLIIARVCTYAYDSQYLHNPLFPYIVTTGEETEVAPTFSDEDFYKTSSCILFDINQAVISDDDPFIQQYRRDALPYVNMLHLQLRKIYIRGAASPDGPYDYNRRLAEKRSKALIGKLYDGLEYQYLETDVEISSVTEDYGYLAILMKEADDPDYELVQQIYDECQNDDACCKSRLQAAQDGALWKRLLEEYFPQLRAARLILWFSEPDKEHRPLRYIPSYVMTDGKFNLIDDSRLDFSKSSALHSNLTDSQDLMRRHMVAARSNLLYDSFIMPQIGWVPSLDLQLEYYPLDGHFTLNAGTTYSNHCHWNTQQFFQIRDFHAALRYYLRGNGEFLGTYVSAYGHADYYGIGLNADKGWQGEGWGTGIGLGYVMPISKSGYWRLEFGLRAGLYRTKYDPYVYGCPVEDVDDGFYYYNWVGEKDDFVPRQYRFTWMGPTGIEIAITRDILFRKKK